MARKSPSKKTDEIDRKGFLRSMIAWSGLTLSYGTLGIIVLRYLWPYKKETIQKIFVGNRKNIPLGHSVTFSMPNGETYLLTYRLNKEGKEEFIAYSNRCPHLGCKVIHEPDKNRYFCPCHGGVFDDSGVATAGPPFKAKQRLKKCDIEVVDNAIYAITGKT